MRSPAIFFLVLFSSMLKAQPKLIVDVTREYQTISGFGAFGGVKPYWEAPPFYTDAFIDNFLHDLGASVVRTNIPWDLEPVNDNSSPFTIDLSKFNYGAGTTIAGQVQYYKALKAAGLKKLVATAWTPPVWMKLFDESDRIPKDCYNCNNCPVGDPNRKVCGGRLDPKYYEEYAEYLVAYVKIVKQGSGVDVYAINIQNEPYFANPFEANVMRPSEYADVLRVVAKRFREEHLTTKLFGPEHMAEWSWGVQKNYVEEILGDAETSPYLDIYSVHSYVDGVAPDYGSAEGWTELKDNIIDTFDKPLWMTETSGFPQTYAGAMDLARSMYLALRFGNVSGWIYWAVSGEPGSDQAMMANGAPTILYYVSKQFFRFIKPGAVRIGAVSEDARVLPLAFKNPLTGEMTLVLINNGTEQVTVQPDIAVRPGQFSVWQTSSNKNAESIGAYSSGTITLPAQSITTFTSSGSTAPSLDEIPDYYLTAGQSSTLEVPLTGITDGGGGRVTIDVQSSDTTAVPSPVLSYSYPSSNATLTLQPNTSQPGKSVITVTLTNQNAIDPMVFGFNASQRQFTVEVTDAVTALKKSDDQAVAIYPNPSGGQLVINVGSDLYAPAIEITDVQGKVFYRQRSAGQKTFFVDTSGWKSAVYIVTLRESKKQVVQKIMIR